MKTLFLPFFWVVCFVVTTRAHGVTQEKKAGTESKLHIDAMLAEFDQYVSKAQREWQGPGLAVAGGQKKHCHGQICFFGKQKGVRNVSGTDC